MWLFVRRTGKKQTGQDGQFSQFKTSQILGSLPPLPIPNNPTLHIHPSLAFVMFVGFSISGVADAEL